MAEFGYKLCCEEQSAPQLVRTARRAEEAGFTFGAISDHFHPWVDRQGQSPFVWAVLGAIARATERLRLGTAVTCPMIRIHPSQVAQAAATVATLAPGRFFLGLGTGENLNEHIHGDPWPPAGVRRRMLEEAVQVIRSLWEGGWVNHEGRHYTVRGARLYSLPDEPPPIYIAGGGPKAVALAGRIGDGYIGLAPDPTLLHSFDEAGGAGKPRYAEVSVCWARTEAEARRTALARWPIAGTKGELVAELPLPRHFEQAAEMLTEDDVARSVVCGPDPERHVARILEFVEAGYTHVWVHQVGPDQDEFLRFYRRDVLPRL